MTLWFFSDPHAGQDFSKFTLRDGRPARPFVSVQEQDDTMIANINAVVKPSDHLYMLGDIAMIRAALCAWVPRITCRHLRLVRGNHDIFKTKLYIELGFEEIYGVRVIDNFLFTHIPVAPWSFGKFRANVHGHVHASAPKIYKKVDPTVEGFVPTWQYVNLSCEATDYQPVSLEQIKSWLP